MPIAIAMPVAHVTGMPDYTRFYNGGSSIFRINYFRNAANTANETAGFRIARSLLVGGTPSPNYYIYAFTDGFISFQNSSIVLRLPREFNDTRPRAPLHPYNQYNSGQHFGRLRPEGPQLRHVVYTFEGANPRVDIEDQIEALLSDLAHPGRTIMKVVDPTPADPANPIISLGDFLQRYPDQLNTLLNDFFAGRREFFVQAGDALGSFYNLPVVIAFRDSCGVAAPTDPSAPVAAVGRPISPSYFLYLVRHTRNAGEVRLRTMVNNSPTGLTVTHPLDHFFSRAYLQSISGNLEHVVDLSSPIPPKPLQYIVPLADASGRVLRTGKGIPLGALGEWHQSRNSASAPTASPLEWRNYGNLPGETDPAQFCMLRTRLRAGADPALLPVSAATFNFDYTPNADDRTRVEAFWNRYGRIVAQIGERLEIPCEIFAALSLAETGGGPNEASALGVEEYRAPRTPSTDPLLAIYQRIRGRGRSSEVVPIPWAGAATAIANGSDSLTWDQLATVVGAFPDSARVSPGMMQTLIGTAMGDLTWLKSVYGDSFLESFSITLPSGVTLRVDPLPATRRELFADWFGVSVDASGNNSRTTVDQELSKLKRAFHSLLAGAAHFKHRYNMAAGSSNLISDYDFPTIGSAYNDGAKPVRGATAPTANETTKWKRIFDLVFYGPGYPRDASRRLNAAIAYFNANTALDPMPTVRLWPGRL